MRETATLTPPSPLLSPEVVENCSVVTDEVLTTSSGITGILVDRLTEYSDSLTQEQIKAEANEFAISTIHFAANDLASKIIGHGKSLGFSDEEAAQHLQSKLAAEAHNSRESVQRIREGSGSAITDAQHQYLEYKATALSASTELSTEQFARVFSEDIYELRLGVLRFIDDYIEGAPGMQPQTRENVKNIFEAITANLDEAREEGVVLDIESLLEVVDRYIEAAHTMYREQQSKKSYVSASLGATAAKAGVVMSGYDG